MGSICITDSIPCFLMAELDEEMNGDMFSFSASSLLKSNVFWPILDLITILCDPVGTAVDDERSLWKFLFETRPLSLKYDLTSPLLLFFFAFLSIFSFPPQSQKIFLKTLPSPLMVGPAKLKATGRRALRNLPF